MRDTGEPRQSDVAVEGQNVNISATGQRSGTGPTSGDQALARARAKSG